MYLAELSGQGYLDQPEFINYLNYLDYWRDPEYVQFITYVHVHPPLLNINATLQRVLLTYDV